MCDVIPTATTINEIHKKIHLKPKDKSKQNLKKWLGRLQEVRENKRELKI